MSTSANNHIPYVPQNTLDPAAGLNEAINVIDALLNTRVESITETSPPSGTGVADGEMYVIGMGATGAWAGHDHAFARYVAEGEFWQFYEAGVEAWLVLNKADGNLYKWNPSTPAWEQAAGIGEAPLDGNYYGRQNGLWSQMPDVSQMVTSVNGSEPDTSGNVQIEIPAEGVISVNGITPDTSGNVSFVTVGQLNPIVDAVLDSSGNVDMEDGFAGKEIRCTDAAAITFSIDTQANSPTRPQVWCFVSQGGTGAVTVVGLPGVTLRTPNGADTTSQYDARGVQHVIGDEWRVW
jgi:hypothetical protein